MTTEIATIRASTESWVNHKITRIPATPAVVPSARIRMRGAVGPPSGRSSIIAVTATQEPCVRLRTSAIPSPTRAAAAIRNPNFNGVAGQVNDARILVDTGEGGAVFSRRT